MKKKNIKYTVVLEYLDELGKPKDNKTLDYTPKSKDEAMKIAEKYPILKGEQVCVYEWYTRYIFKAYNVYVVKRKASEFEISTNC